MSEFSIDLSGVSIDSRTIQRGDLFVALSGDPGRRFGSVANARNGHRFIPMAIENGAGAIMCNSDYTIESPQIKVSDTLDGLWMLAAAARERFGGQVVAITGSNGKTTMRAWLEQLLAPVGNTHASFASYNNHWGVPLSLSCLLYTSPSQRDRG